MFDYFQLPVHWHHFLSLFAITLFVYVIWKTVIPFKFRKSVGLIHFIAMGVCVYIIWIASLALLEVNSEQGDGLLKQHEVDSSLNKSTLTMVARDALHIRQCPNTSCHSVRVVSAGEILIVRQNLDSDWVEVLSPVHGFSNSLWMQEPSK